MWRFVLSNRRQSRDRRSRLVPPGGISASAGTLTLLVGRKGTPCAGYADGHGAARAGRAALGAAPALADAGRLTVAGVRGADTGRRRPVLPAPVLRPGPREPGGRPAPGGLREPVRGGGRGAAGRPLAA